MTTSLLGDAFAHHIWATERLIDECAALTPEQLKAPAPGTNGCCATRGSDRFQAGFRGFARVETANPKVQAPLARLNHGFASRDSGEASPAEAGSDCGREVGRSEDL
jgi:hypothetical protein